MTKIDGNEMDKAGQDYWNQVWGDTPLPSVWDVDSPRLGNYVERAFFSYLTQALKNGGFDRRETKLVEVGCARSQVLPVLAKKMEISVAGVDYSPNGCEQTRLILKREGVGGDVFCCDIFSIPEQLSGRFDVVISFGLIEHFSNSDEIVKALAKLLKPGGLIFTNIPNMRGLTGFFQKIMNRAIYDVHVPLTPKNMRTAHENAGLHVLECDYFLSSNFGVVNIGTSLTGSPSWWMKKIVMAFLVRASMVIWTLERMTSRLPAKSMFSPYVNCVAIKKLDAV